MNSEELRAHVLSLSEPVTVKELKPLLDAEFTVRVTGMEWCKEVVKYDKLSVTGVEMSLDLASLTGVYVRISMDYCLNHKLVFNACTGLKGLQNYLLNK